MQLFISFLMTLNLFSISNPVHPVNDTEGDATNVVIEIQNFEDIPFDFTMKFEERRKIIKIRSAEPIKSLRTVETATNNHKGYNVIGSDLIILPLRDFNPGSYIAELKFQNNPTVVLANIHVMSEAAVADGE